MADSQVKARNLCNIVSTTTLHSNVGGSGTFIRNNSIAVYMSGNDNTSGVYIAILPESPSVGETFTISFVPVCSVDNVLRLNLFGVVQTITYTSGQRVSITFTTLSNVSRIIAFYGGNLTEKTVQIYDIQIESGSTAHNYQPYSSTGWVHSLRKLTTATETITSGQTIYANGQPITAYTIKGNTVQNGTPSPSNPVTVQGVGVRTENLWNEDYIGIMQDVITYLPLNVGNGDYTLSSTTTRKGQAAVLFLLAGNVSTGATTVNDGVWSGQSRTVTAVGGYVTIGYRKYPTANPENANTMLNVGSTAKPYEPYGYKIPISNGQQTIDIYIGDLPLLKSLDGTAVDEISNGMLTRRVDSDGSVLPTPTTTQITMPSIPTTEGANSITVDTTVQPSEFTATWTGWHNASVKEWNGSQWNE